MDHKEIVLKIDGMTCEACAAHVREALQGVEGVKEVEVRLTPGEACVVGDDGLSSDALVAAVERAGYRAEAVETGGGGGRPGNREGRADYDLLILGGGSAAFAAAIRGTELGARVAMVNAGAIGGTCVNVGCVPSKTLIRAAEAHHRATHHPFEGIASTSRVSDFTRIIGQKDALVNALRQAKYVEVLQGLENVTFIEGRGRLVSPRRVEVAGRTLNARRLIIATGASPWAPGIPGLAAADYLTSTTAFELRELPKSMIVLGGRYVALECSQMFARLGTRVTILQRSERILPAEDPDLTKALTGYLQAEGMEIVTGVAVREVERDEKGYTVHAQVNGHTRAFRAKQLLCATGRRPNTAGIGLEEVGVEVRPDGAVQVDEFLETTVPGIYAAGDAVGDPSFVYTAAYEGALAAENALSGNRRQRDYTALPWVIFTDPQVAGVGLNETDARAQGLEVDVAVLPLEHVPRALAARDTRGFIKLIRAKGTDRLLGARILAPEGGELVMQASLAIRYQIPVSDLAKMFHPYLTLSEGIKLAAQTFGKDVAKLSCCAA